MIICLIVAAFLGVVSPEKVLLPQAVNIARLNDSRTVTATSTCGVPPAEYCRANLDCSVCNGSSHSVEKMTDGNLRTNWQSVTWWEWYKANNDTNEPLKANVTISFNKSYAITDEVRIIFRYPRPKQMLLEKSTDKGLTWTPLQYYADDCEERFGMANVPIDTNLFGNFGVQCVEEYSSFNPQHDGRMVFDSLRRYREDDFWNATLQKYFTATDLRMQLLYPGTDGQENLENKVESAFKQFFYGISDLTVNVRCQCNGHGEFCDYPDLQGKDCDCEHNTEGEDCERCKPLFNNRTWMPASSDSEPNPCQECECHDHADSCHYNKTLDHGVCDDCYHNTTGLFCERCIDKFYRNMSKPLNDPKVCLSCNCFNFGITNNGTCNQTTGQCECKQNVTGRQCDGCEDTFWGFQLPPVGSCLECDCHTNGTKNGSLSCNQESGLCPCKTNIHLRNCSECKDGFFSFPTSVDADCLQCDCDYGGSVKEICGKVNGTCLCRTQIHGKRCTEVQEGHFFGFFTHLKYEAELAMGDYNPVAYFTGVDQEFTGRGYASLRDSQFVTFTLNLSTEFSDFYSVVRYTADNKSNVSLTLTITSCNGSNCSVIDMFMLSQLPHGQGLAWMSPRPVQFMKHQTYHMNLTYESGMYINSTIEIDSLILLPDVHDTRIYQVAKSSGSVHGLTLGDIEECWENSTTIKGSENSPDVCQNVTFSVMAEVFDGALACSCNSTGTKNGTTCHVFGGHCDCKPGVTGESCNRCLPGYFNFTANGCSACNCSELGSLDLVCNAVTGQCPCKPGVVNRACNRCNATFYGFHTGQGCVECNCNVSGSANLQCDDRTGVCPCKNSTRGTKCDMCHENFFNFTSEGCQPCNCHEGGSSSLQCHLNTGICSCKANAEGTKCEQCKNGTYNSDPHNPDGCSPCYCFGRSNTCSSARNFVKSLITAKLSNSSIDQQGFVSLEDSGNSFKITFRANSSVQFTFRYKFNGNHLHSYGQVFMLTMEFADEDSLDSSWSVKLTGSNGQNANFDIRPAPSLSNTAYRAQLHERYSKDNLTAYELQSILAALESFALQGNFKANGSVHVNIQLVTATMGVGQEVGFVENCTCPNNYTELSCGFCNQGFTRQSQRVSSLNVFTACVLCSCNDRSRDCHPENGTCYNCRTGSEGDRCERCQSGVDNSTDCTRCIPGFYGLTPSSGGCRDCECVLPNTLYGNSSVCNMTTGQCVCKPKIAGRPCDRCHENAYNTSHGCVDCPECYRLIQVEVEKLRRNIKSLEETLERLRNGRIGDASFAQRLSASINSTRDLVMSADESVVTEQGLRNEIRQLNETLNQLEHVLNTEVSPGVRELDANLTRLQRDRNTTEHLIKLIQDTILYSHSLMNSSIEPSLRETESISDHLSHLMPRFSLIAGNSSTTAALQNSTAGEINRTVENALSKILEAENVAVTAVSDQEDLNKFLNELKTGGALIQALGEQVNITGHYVYSNASLVLLQANTTLLEVTQLDPNISKVVMEVESAAFEAQARALELSSRAINLTQAYVDLITQVEAAVEEVRALMSLVSKVEANGEAILTEANRAKNEAINAVNLASKTHTDAQEMLHILQNFENKSREAEEFATRALQLAKEANETSWNAIQFAQQINASIQTTLSVAREGLQLAEQAKSISLSENQNVSAINDEAIKLSRDAAESKYTSGYFHDVNQNVTSIQSASQGLSEACETNYSVVASDALETAQDAKDKADNASEAARHVRARVELVVEESARLQQVNMTRLQELREEIKIVRSNFTQMDISGVITELRNAKDEQRQFINENESKVREMRKQIDELKQLLGTLPTVTCDTPRGALL